MNLQLLARQGVLTSAEGCIGFLRRYGLLAKTMDCPRCANPMQEEKTEASKNDGFRWRCKESGCRTTTTVRKGSFFEKSNAGLTQLVLVIYFWAMEALQRQIANESGLSEATIVSWAKLLRGICTQDLAGRRRPLGGPGKVVSIDETQVARRKWHTNAQGRPIKELWLFGGIEHSTKRCFIELVPPEGRTASVMQALIVKHVAEGTTIWSDQFASYKNIGKLGRGYVHATVNHSKEYISEQGVHTNHIESLWADLKYKFKRMKGVAREQIQSYLDEWLWRRQYPVTEHFEGILMAVARHSSHGVAGRATQQLQGLEH